MIEGIRVGHWTNADAATGMTVFLLPDGAVVAAEARGQNSGTLNVPVFEPKGSADHASALVLTGGSAYGLAAAAHVGVTLGERGYGVPTAGGPVPFVLGAVIFDLLLGERAWPDPAAAVAAIDAAVPAGEEEVGCVGVGTGALTGQVYGLRGTTKGGFGRAHVRTAQGATVAVWAAVNPVGDVLDTDNTIIAGLRDGDRFAGVTRVLSEDVTPALDWGRATTLLAIATDARLDKRETWRLAQAGHNGIAHAISPSATGLDGDTAFAVATGRIEGVSALALEAVTAEVTAQAIRNAVWSATSLHGVPSASELREARG